MNGMTYQEKDELAAELGFSLPNDVTDKQAVYTIDNYNYLNHLLKGARKNETLRDNKRA